MRCMRRRTEFVVLAIVALAAQILLSLGHSPAGHAVYRTAHNSAALQCRSFLPPAADQPCAPHHDDGKDCAICWTIGMAGAGVLGAPPALAVPILGTGTTLPVCEALKIPRTETAAFHARGPPSSIPA